MELLPIKQEGHLPRLPRRLLLVLDRAYEGFGMQQLLYWYLWKPDRGTGFAETLHNVPGREEGHSRGSEQRGQRLCELRAGKRVRQDSTVRGKTELRTEDLIFYAYSRLIL